MTAIVDTNWHNVTFRYKNPKNTTDSVHLKKVTLATELDEENLTKILSLINIAKSTSKFPDGKTPTKILDLLRVEERITIDGYLADGVTSYNANGTEETSFDVGDGDGTQTYTESSTSRGKKTDLKNMVLGGGVVWMTYEGSTFKVAIEKLSIKSENKEGKDPSDGEIGFSVKLTCIKGEDAV